MSPVVKVLAQISTKETHYGTRIPFDKIEGELLNLSSKHIGKICLILKDQGCLTLRPQLGQPPFHSVRLTPSFYAEFASYFDNDPNADAVEMAQKLLDHAENSISASNLEASIGWGDRWRFNRAFALVVERLSDRFVSQAIQSDYPKAGVVLLPEARAKLREFIGENS